MKPTVKIRDLSFSPGSQRDIASGLLGYLSLVLGDAVRLDGLTLRRNTAGGLSISYPARTDGRGRKHPLVSPVDEEVREELEAQILTRLREGAS